jgi:hypothetical protein
MQSVFNTTNDGFLLQLAAQIERALRSQWNDGRRARVHVTQITPP